ncbi:MAG: hypothetical protein JXA99_03665 [Candidatus Lokiarchaeota archaeon]|nr:hypothetical protein [Candidatus Lokiarchaeota archaeon]
MNKRNSQRVLFLCLITFMMITISSMNLKFGSQNILEDNVNNAMNIKSSNGYNYTGNYEGGICTMGIKLEEYSTIWNNQNSSSVLISHNNTYSSDNNDLFNYNLSRIDIRAFNLYDGSGNFSIASNSSDPKSIDHGYMMVQEFMAPDTSDLLAIDTLNLYISHNIPGILIGVYIYIVYVLDESFTSVLGAAIKPINGKFVDDWITFNMTSNILEANTKYNILYLIGKRGLADEDWIPYEDNSWKAQNKTIPPEENMGLTRIYDGINLIPIIDDYRMDMLCNFTYRKIINPERVNLSCRINNEYYKPTYQKSLSTGELGYEALLIHNFQNSPTEDVNISIFTNKTINYLQIEIKCYYVHEIKAFGTFNASNGIIEWNIAYQNYDIGSYGPELWFLYESDWELQGFYNTIGTEIEVFFGPYTLYNESYYGLFDLWQTPLGIGTCIGKYQSPNYCNNINSKIKIGEEFQDKGYLQLGETVRFEAEIRNSFNEPISGGNGSILFVNPYGQVVYNASNLISYNGILNSSEIELSTNLGVGIYRVDISWTNGKALAFYSIFIEVKHPEGYISPEMITLIIALMSLIGASIPSTYIAHKYLKQRHWEKTLRHLFVLSKSGTSMYDYSFGIEAKNPELISGMISALTSFIKEATGSKKSLRTIDQQDKKLILNHGKYITVALLCDKDLPIIHKRISGFTESFENNYGKYLLNWNGEQSIFKGTEALITKYFPVSMEDQVIRGVRQKLMEFRERLLFIENPRDIIPMMREITEFTSHYQEIVNKFAYKDFNELIKISEEKIRSGNQ